MEFAGKLLKGAKYYAGYKDENDDEDDKKDNRDKEGETTTAKDNKEDKDKDKEKQKMELATQMMEMAKKLMGYEDAKEKPDEKVEPEKKGATAVAVTTSGQPTSAQPLLGQLTTGQPISVQPISVQPTLNDLPLPSQNPDDKTLAMLDTLHSERQRSADVGLPRRLENLFHNREIDENNEQEVAKELQQHLDHLARKRETDEKFNALVDALEAEHASESSDHLQNPLMQLAKVRSSKQLASFDEPPEAGPNASGTEDLERRLQFLKRGSEDSVEVEVKEDVHEARQRILEEHVQSDPDENWVKCPVCGVACLNEKTLKGHLAKSHPR